MKVLGISVLLLMMACGHEHPVPPLPVQALQLTTDLSSQEKLTAKVFHDLQYPLVLHHGLMGGAKIGSFGDMAALFEGQGITVFKTEVSPAHSIAVRGAQFANQIQDILQNTGAAKVNIVAHSMGGLDARYAISTLGLADQVASLTTIATPHMGTPVARIGDELHPRRRGALLNKMVALIGSFANDSSRELPSNLKAALHDLTPEFLSKTFNPQNPDQPQVYYQSYAGITGIRHGDRTGPLLTLLRPFVEKSAGASDGLVPVSSAKWGNFRKLLVADHIDLAGPKRLLPRRHALDFKKFFQDLVSDLANMGY